MRRGFSGAFREQTIQRYGTIHRRMKILHRERHTRSEAAPPVRHKGLRSSIAPTRSVARIAGSRVSAMAQTVGSVGAVTAPRSIEIAKIPKPLLSGGRHHSLIACKLRTATYSRMTAGPG